MDINDILANVPREGEQLSEAPSEEQQETETPAESPAEEQPTEESPAPAGEQQDNSQEEQKLPFHKHPRWKEMYESNKQMKDELSRIRSQMEQHGTQQTTTQQPVPERWKKLLGENPEAWDLWRQEVDEMTRNAIAQMKKEAEAERTAEQTAVKQGEQYVANALEELEAEGHQFDRNELVKFMLDFKEKYGTIPTDENGNIDFRKGYDLFSQLHTDTSTAKKSEARKRIADFTTSDKRHAETPEKEFVTSTDLRGKDWDNIDT